MVLIPDIQNYILKSSLLLQMSFNTMTFKFSPELFFSEVNKFENS